MNKVIVDEVVDVGNGRESPVFNIPAELSQRLARCAAEMSLTRRVPPADIQTLVNLCVILSSPDWALVRRNSILLQPSQPSQH